jgi:hypothetical protein
LRRRRHQDGTNPQGLIGRNPDGRVAIALVRVTSRARTGFSVWPVVGGGLRLIGL